MSAPRRKRFHATPNSDLLLTERDAQILLGLYRYRFLDSRQIERLINMDSRQHLQRRLRKLFDHRYIDRPTSQIVGVNRPMIYGLGQAGVEFLIGKYELYFGRVSGWHAKNQQTGRLFLDHTLAVADQLLAFETAMRDHPTGRFIDQTQILNARTVEQIPEGHALGMKTKINWNRRDEDVTIVPDGMFGLHFPDADDKSRYQFYMLETDEGHMPIVRREFRQSSILKKLMGYTQIILSRQHEAAFNIKAFRLLIVTTSWERIQTIQNTYKTELRKDIGPGFILLTTKADLANSSPLSPDFRIETASGKHINLI